MKRFVLLVAGALLLIACDSDDEESTSSTSTSGTGGNTGGGGTGGTTSTSSGGGEGGATGGSGGSGSGVGGGGGAGGTGGPHGTCGTGGPTGTHNLVSLSSGDYLIWAPANNPSQPVPLVMGLHGDEGHPDQALTYIWGGVWNNHQDFVLVLPICPGASHSWYQDNPSSHAAFLSDVLQDVAGAHNVDIDRAYAVGYSGGSCFLSGYGTQFQDVFAGIQWSCGGCNLSYTAPPKPECKVDARFHISDDDFLLSGAQGTAQGLQDNGHDVTWVTAQCSGHCCANGVSDAEGAYSWFLQRTKCDATGEGCGNITDVP
ncbi:MAG: hypothetical protein JRI68_13655 [Deltaproteobacteria bacterium]|nr:hypothetical protein [Deltaproteobacteria bacterium]